MLEHRIGSEEADDDSTGPSTNRRHVPHAGHLGFELCPHRHRASLRDTPVHNLLYALHVGLARGERPGLGAMWGKEKATEMLREAGFGRVRVETLPHDPMNYFYIATLSL
jgi:hypothetical protein